MVGLTIFLGLLALGATSPSIVIDEACPNLEYTATDLTSNWENKLAVYFVKGDVTSIDECARFCLTTSFCQTALYSQLTAKCSLLYLTTSSCILEPKMAKHASRTGLVLLKCISCLEGPLPPPLPLQPQPQIDQIKPNPTIPEESSESSESPEISSSCTCSTAGCAHAAVNLLNAMDQTVDPCQDFYGYACGGWIRDNPIPDDKARYSIFSEVRERVTGQLKGLLTDESNKDSSRPVKMAQQFYSACLNIDDRNKAGSKPLYEDLKQLGSMPMLSGANWECSGLDPTLLLSQVHRLHSTTPFFSFYPYADSRDTTRVVLYIDQGSTSLGFSTRDYFLDPRHKRVITALKRMMKQSVMAIAEDNELDIGQVDKDIDDLVAFETKLAEILTAEADRRNETKLYNPRKIRDLQKLLPFIEWDRYFDNVLSKDVRQFVTPDTDIIVREFDFFPKLVELLSSFDDCRVMTNYIFWRVIDGYLGSLDEKFEDISQDFQKVFSGRPEKPKRWKKCVSATTTNLDQAAGALYVRKHFDSKDRSEAMTMIEYLRTTFMTMLDELDWMDESTKNTAKEKANAIDPQIGFPDLAFEDALLEKYYNDLEFQANLSYYELIKPLTRWGFDKSLRKLLKPYDKKEWFTSPAVVNAYYSPSRNQITFPAGILQSPFFDGDFPKSINYGSMGFVIGHEITHGFDDQGRQYDKIGNLREWWQADTANKYAKKAQCIIDQYSNIEVPNTKGQHINGKLTQGENIADNGGLKEAYIAYRNYIKSVGEEEPRLPGLTHLNGDQLFFVSAAQFFCGNERPQSLLQQILTDPHSPERYRVNIPMANLPQFAETFQCKAGSPLNPPKRCSVW